MKKRVIEIIREVMKENNKEKGVEISELTSLRKDLDFDSLDLAILTVKIEDEYDVDIFEDGIIDTVAELMDKLS